VAAEITGGNIGMGGGNGDMSGGNGSLSRSGNKDGNAA
jgi:hypothetical protein